MRAGFLKSPIQPKMLKTKEHEAMSGVEQYRALLALIADLEGIKLKFQAIMEQGEAEGRAYFAELDRRLGEFKAQSLTVLGEQRSSIKQQLDKHIGALGERIISDYEKQVALLTRQSDESVLQLHAAIEQAKKINKGDPGKPGKDGKTPKKGVDYFDGEPGKPGESVKLEEVAAAVIEYLKKNGIPMSAISGLVNELASYRSSAMLGGQTRGGGDTVSAGTGISITYDSNGNKVITNTGTASNEVWGEVPTGSGTAFTIANTPTAGTLRLYRGGIRIIEGAGEDYTLSGVNITLATALETGEKILADYKYI